MHGRKSHQKMKDKHPDLFEEAGLVRSTDPDTSRMAAKRVDAAGLMKLVVECLDKNYPLAMSAIEIAFAVGKEPGSITPRMIQLERRKLVERFGKKLAPPATGRGRQTQQIAWRAVRVPH